VAKNQSGERTGPVSANLGSLAAGSVNSNNWWGKMQEKCLVVLDTGPVRDLAHAPEIPGWVGSFARMTADGYRFSLADHACAELMNQRSKGAIDDRGFATMIEYLERFLDADMPVMLGGKDILRAIGGAAVDETLPAASALSQFAWSELCKLEVQAEPQVEPLLEEERTEWKELFRKTEEMYEEWERPELDEDEHPLLDALLASMDEGEILSPPLSLRWDLRTRYFWRQFVRNKKAKEPYNPHAKKKRNDGIDFGLFAYLALPALCVASESGFHDKIANIPSFQLGWIYHPTELAKAWSEGPRPQPQWP
jgi:hypothetical protein